MYLLKIYILLIIIYYIVKFFKSFMQKYNDVFALVAVTFFLVQHEQRRREKARTTWIAGVSHDVRTPLSLVIGYADEILRLADKSGISESQADILKRAQVIEEQAVRIKDLVINLNMENKLTYGMGIWKKELILLPDKNLKNFLDIYRLSIYNPIYRLSIYIRLTKLSYHDQKGGKSSVPVKE